MPTIKSITNFTYNKSKLGFTEHCNKLLSPVAVVTASVPSLAELLTDEHYSLYNQENLEAVIQQLEKIETQKINEEEPPAPKRKKIASSDSDE